MKNRSEKNLSGENLGEKAQLDLGSPTKIKGLRNVTTPEDLKGDSVKIGELEVELGKKFDEQDQEISLGAGDFIIEAENTPGKKHRIPKFARSLLLSIGIGMGSVGAVENISAQDKTPEKIERSEEDKQAIDLLREIFISISSETSAFGKTIWMTKTGDLGIHIGGTDYYELKGSHLAELMNISKRYTGQIRKEMEKKNLPVVLQLKKGLSEIVKEKIREVGTKLSFDELPPEIKKIDIERKQLKR